MKARTFGAVVMLSMFLSGCPELIPVMQGVMNAAQWIGSVIEVADHSQRTWFTLNPDAQKQIAVETALLRVRKALAAMNSVALASKSLEDNDVAKARAELIEAYKAVEVLFLSLNVPLQPGMKAMEPPRIVESARVEAALKE